MLKTVIRLIAVAGIAGMLVHLYDSSEARVQQRFHRISYHNESTWPENRWLGIKTQQNPNDVWITQEIIYETKPDYIIETGTNRGGSAMLWAMLLREVNPDGKVVTIDIKDRSAEARQRTISKDMITFMHGSSVDASIVAEIATRTKGKKTMVLLDSDYRRNHVIKELAVYAPMVSVGSYLIVQDTNVNGNPVRKDFGPGPMEAVNEFLDENTNFEIDRSRERLLFTMHPRGYLKRVK